MNDISLYEAIHTQRTHRRFRPEPVDDALIEQILEAATRAPSGSNKQPWRFIVVKDAGVKAKLGALYDAPVDAGHGMAQDRTPWAQVPVLIVVCAYTPPGEQPQGQLASAASILPAVQNLLLAARSLGIGTVLTTRWHAFGEQCRAILGLPETAEIRAIIPAGWPVGRFGPTSRLPVEQVTFRDRWGAPWSAGG